MDDKTEAVVICLDNSEYMRNEDYIPNRWGAQTQGVSWIFNSIGASHAFGLISMAKTRPQVLSPVVTNITTLHQSLDLADVGGECNIKLSMQLAQMILRNRSSKCTATRVIMFVGSPISDSLESLSDIAKTYRKTGIALDVVSFGDASPDVLRHVVNIADRNGNSHFTESSPEDHTLSVSVMDILLPDGMPLQPPALRRPHIEHAPPPVLRMPPPNRVCRRVVVDHTKYASQKSVSSPPPSTLSLSLTLSLSSPRHNINNSNNSNSSSSSGSSNSGDANSSTRPNAGEKDSRLVLLVPLPSQRNKKIITEFRAGRCQVSGTMVRAIKKKGQLALLLINDDILQLVWRDRASGAIEVDLLVHSREATFTRVPAHITPDRVYCLHLSDSNKRHFFWMQHGDEAKDQEYCDIINSYLARGPSTTTHTAVMQTHTGSSSSSSSFSSSRAQYHTLNAADLQQLLALYSLPSSLPLLRGGGGGAGGGMRPTSLLPTSSQSLNLRGRASRWSSQLEEAHGPARGKWIKNPLWAQQVDGSKSTNELGVGEHTNSSSLSSATPHAPPVAPSVLITAPPAAALLTGPPTLLSASPTTPLLPTATAIVTTTPALPIPSTTLLPSEPPNPSSSTPTPTPDATPVPPGTLATTATDSMIHILKKEAEKDDRSL